MLDRNSLPGVRFSMQQMVLSLSQELKWRVPHSPTPDSREGGWEEGGEKEKESYLLVRELSLAGGRGRFMPCGLSNTNTHTRG